LPAHNHAATATPALAGSVSLAASGTLQATKSYGTSDTPGTNLFPAMAPDYVSQGLSADNIYGAPDGNTTMPVNVVFTQNPAPVTVTGNVNVTIQPNGTSQGHSNIQPVLAMQYIIAVNGIYPSFS
jgi:microcystin-dependent protein